jgi:hypothetical protein
MHITTNLLITRTKKIRFFLGYKLTKEAEIDLLKEIRKNPFFKELLNTEQPFKD